MVAFTFETAGTTGEEYEAAPDILDMINGGEHAEPEIEEAEFVSVPLKGEPPEFGDTGETEEKDETIPPEGDDSESDDDEGDESDENIDEEIEDARATFTNTALMRSRIEAELKSIKETEKELLKNLQQLLDKKSDMKDEVKQDAVAPAVVEPESTPEGEAVATVLTEEVKPVACDPSWWSISAESILANVPRLGDKKREALLATFSDLKAMEDLRGEASRQFKHFSELLPQGIGKGLADAIENEMLKAIS